MNLIKGVGYMRIVTTKILILETSLIIALDLAVQLIKEGYEVIGIHAKVDEALCTLQEQKIDLLIFDIDNFPKSTVLEVSRQIWQCFPMPIVFIGVDTNVKLFQKEGLKISYAFLPKPFNRKILLKVTERLLNPFEEGFVKIYV
ncbi:MAG: response regulator [Flavobacteriaceae bacterium]